MRPLVKASLVLGGYAAAVAVAYAVTSIYEAATAGAGPLQSAGMFAFGESLLFLAVFTVAAVPATAAALYFLRPYQFFWSLLSAAAIVAAATSIAALFGYVFSHSGVAVLRIFVAPASAILFLVSGIFAPNRSARLIFLGTTAVEIVAFVCVVFVMTQRPSAPHQNARASRFAQIGAPLRRT
jgi:hypothetical protein